MSIRLGISGVACCFVAGSAAAQTRTVRVALSYRAPVEGQPKPNFSPKGTQVPLLDVDATATLPAGSIRPAKVGVMRVGPDRKSWISVLVTADAEHPQDLTRLFIDRNRNGRFTDERPANVATVTQNVKTRAWWSSVSKVELLVPYSTSKAAEPYLVNFWIVREDSAAAPEILRFSTGSWRYGTVKVNGTDALVAVMDSDNDALFTKRDTWSAMSAADSNAAQAVLSIAEARPANRLMFLSGVKKEQVIEFRSITSDGRSMEFAVLDRPITKAGDRGPDDKLKDERARPRATVPFVWGHGRKDFTATLADAKKSGKKILLDFEATWCGPCHTMDQWIWNDAEVAAELNAGYLGVKIDVDIEKPLVARFKTTGYPTMILLDPNGAEIKRAADYLSSKDMLAFLRGKP